jgi:L-malate glycosyltransferase
MHILLAFRAPALRRQTFSSEPKAGAVGAMPKVLHLLSRFDVGGTERQLVERLRRHPRGFEPLLACNRPTGAFLGPIRALGLEPISIPWRGIVHPTGALGVLRLAAVMKLHDVDLVHANDYAMSVLGLPAARLAGVPFVTNRVDCGHLRPGFGVAHRKLEAFAARNSDIVCANADAVRKVCIEEEGCDPERVMVVRNGLDIARFDSLAAQEPAAPTGMRPDDFNVAVVGNLWPVKGHTTLVEAAALLATRAPGIRFFCVGEGVMRPALEKRLRDLGIEDRVVLLGHRSDVPAILARANALALCSSNEGLSNAIMEAMAARLPVVATRVGGNPELLDGGRGLLVPYGDPRALAEAVLRISASTEDARAMGRKGRAFVEAELSLERMRTAHEEVYWRALDLPVPAAAESPKRLAANG